MQSNNEEVIDVPTTINRTPAGAKGNITRKSIARININSAVAEEFLNLHNPPLLVGPDS